MRVIDISIKDALIRYKGYKEADFDTTKDGYVTTCPLHGGDKFYIYDKTSQGKGWDYFCYSCPSTKSSPGAGGNLIALLMKLDLATDAKEATDKLQKDYHLAPPDRWDVNTFADFKGLNAQLLIDNGWYTESNGLYVPYYDVDGNIIAEKIRCHPEAGSKYYFKSGNAQPYGLNWLKDTEETTVYIAEGETDTLTLKQAGFMVVGIPSCNAWKAHFTAYFDKFTKVIIVKDTDSQGNSLVEDISRCIPDKTYVAQLPRYVKDVNDFHQFCAFSNIEVFRELFHSVPVLPSTCATLLKECETNPEIASNINCWKLLLPQLSNPIERDRFVGALSKLTNINKGSIHEMIDRASIEHKELPNWYTVTKSGVELNAELYADHLVETQPMARVNKMWYLYTAKGVYRQVDDTYILNLIRKNLIPECSKEPKNIKDTLFYLETSIELNKEYDDFDKDLMVLNVKNGLLDLNTMSLVPHTPKHLSMVQRNVNYVPGLEKSAIFTEFLANKLSDANTQMLAQEMLGYAISNFYGAEKWFLIFGRGRSGKGTFLNIIHEVLGSEYVSNVALQNLSERFNKARLFGKLANIDGDLSRGYLTDDAINMLKKCVGRDYIDAEYKGVNGFNFINRATMIFACNDLPQNAGDTKNASFWSKLVLLKMDNSDIDNVKTSFKYELVAQDSLDSIFIWALEGLKRLIDNDFIFTECTDSTELKDIYKRSSSSAITFVEECCEVGDPTEFYTLSDEFMTKYEQWCKTNKKNSKSTENALVDITDYYRDICNIERKRTRRAEGNRWYVLGVRCPTEF